MFPVKRFPAAKREEKRVRYERFARFGGGGSGCLRATGGENCDCSDGSIRPGIGLTESEFSALVSTLPHPPDRFLCFPAHGENEEKFFVSLSNGRVYVYDGSQDEFVEAYCQLDPPMCWTIVRNGEGEPEIAVGDGLDIWRYDRETGFFVRQYEFIPSALCFFGERLFAAEGERVHYSAPLAPFDFAESADEGGYIDFPSDDGGILALSALADGVYAFRARSVFRLKADGAGRDFASEKIGYGSFPRTDCMLSTGRNFPPSVRPLLFLLFPGRRGSEGSAERRRSPMFRTMRAGKGCSYLTRRRGRDIFPPCPPTDFPGRAGACSAWRKGASRRSPPGGRCPKERNLSLSPNISISARAGGSSGRNSTCGEREAARRRSETKTGKKGRFLSICKAAARACFPCFREGNFPCGFPFRPAPR